jgi:hypothetical protein
MDGRYETQYPMETGALPYGCQSITYDWDRDLYWLACYGGEHAGQETRYQFFAVDIKKPYAQRVVQRWKYGSSCGIEYLGNRVFYTSGGDGIANLSIMMDDYGMKRLAEGSIVTRFPTTSTKTNATTTEKTTKNSTSKRQNGVTTETTVGGGIVTNADSGKTIQTTQGDKTVKTDDSVNTTQTEGNSEIIGGNTASTKNKTKKTTGNEIAEEKVEEIIESPSEPFPWWTIGVLAGLAAVIAGIYILVAKKINS